MKRLLISIALCFSLGFAQHIPERYFERLPFNMPKIQPPDIPGNVFNIADFGATGDGITLNSKYIADAIQACSKAGGGKVIIPPGIWLTGPIELASNVNLHIEKGAILLFSKRIEDYPIVPHPTPNSKNFGYMTLIYGFNLENIAITGGGLVDGSGDIWRPKKKEKYTEAEWKEIIESGGALNNDGTVWYPSKQAMQAAKYFDKLNKQNKGISIEDVRNTREYLRPNMVEFYGCKNILIEGVTFQNSPKFALYPTQCENLIIRNIKVRNPWNAQNGDGIDINACHNVVVYDCIVDVGDDGICLKLGKPDKKRGWNFSCENIIIADCIVYRGHGGFVIGSNTDGGARNVLVRNCVFSGTDIGLRFKSARGRGGLVENVYIEDISMNDIINEAILFDLHYVNIGVGTDPGTSMKKQDFDSSQSIPVFQNFRVSNILCNNSKVAIYINSLPEKVVRSMVFDGITITSKKGVQCHYADSIKFRNVNIISETSPIYELSNCSNIIIEKSQYTHGIDVFLRIRGKDTKGIKLTEIDKKQAKELIKLDSELSTDVVKIE